MINVESDNFIAGKQDNSRWMMKLGEYEFPISETQFISDDSGLDVMNFANSEMMFGAVLETDTDAEDVEKEVKAKHIETINLAISDGYSVRGNINHCVSIGQRLYVFVRFKLDE